MHPLDQGVLAVQAAFPEVKESIADWPIGRRNRALAELRCAAFGEALRGWTACRQCGEKLEFELDGRELAKGMDEEATRVEVGGEMYRLPTSRDLAAVAGENDAVAATRRLLRECLADSVTGKSDWSEEEIDEVGERMAAAWVLEELGLAGGAYDVQTIAKVIFYAARDAGSDVEAAAKMLLDAANAAIAEGDLVNVFWFKDRKYARGKLLSKRDRLRAAFMRETEAEFGPHAGEGGRAQ